MLYAEFLTCGLPRPSSILELPLIAENLQIKDISGGRLALTVGNNPFSAAASAAGYLYQARLALVRCIPYVNAQSSVDVAIERLDDISFESEGTALELLQAKHHIDRVGGLTDTSADLWKTIRVWAEAASADPSLPTRVRLLLVTTGVIPAGSIAALLRPPASYGNEHRRSPQEAQKRLTKIAETSENTALKSAFNAFLALTPSMRSSLLSAIEILDSQPLLSDLEKELEDSLRLVAPKSKLGIAREMLEGWWWPAVCKALMETPPQKIPIANIETKLDDIREVLKREALVADFEHANPTEQQVAEMDGLPFVRQMEVIGLGGNRITYAKRDYYRSFAQRSKWTREHVVLDDELEKFEARLIEEWQPRFAAMCEAHYENTDPAALKQAGQAIYQWVETEARCPFRSLTARFLTVGSYHILANTFRVGWHKDYAALCWQSVS